MNYSTKIEQLQTIGNCLKSKYFIKTTLNLCSIIIMLCLYSQSAIAYTIADTVLTAETLTEAISAPTTAEKAAITKLIVTGEIQGTSCAPSTANSEWDEFRTLRAAGGYAKLTDIEILTSQTMPSGTSGSSWTPNAVGVLTNQTWLKSFSAPNIKNVGGFAFYGCNALIEINFPLVTDLGSNAFYGCSKLTSVDFPLVTEISLPNMFQNCSALESINFPLLTTVSGAQTFYGCTKLTSANLIFPELVEAGYYMFYNCDGLTAVDNSMFPKLTKLGTNVSGLSYTFSSCDNITSVTLDNVTEIGQYVFYYCNKLETIKFPALTRIPLNAFGYIGGLKEIKEDFFPNVTTIDSNAFYPQSTVAQSNLTSVVFPNATELGGNSFGGNGNYIHRKLEKVSFPKLRNLNAAAFRNCPALKVIDGNSFPALETLPANAFEGCMLESVTLPRLLEMPESMFFDANSLMPSTLTTVNIPACKTINADAFLNCVSLQTINMLSIETIGANAFNGCISLTTNIDGTNCPNLTTIEESAFSGCTKLKVASASKITELSTAFSGCTALETAHFPALISIEPYAFSNCENLKSIDFSNATIIKANAFANCNALSSEALVFPQVTTIEPNAFNNCQSLTSISQTNFPALTVLDGFTNCFYLREVDFPNITTIKSTAFSGCAALSTLNLDAVQTIEGEASSFPNGAFSGCIALTTLSDEIFSNLQSIGANAFYGCDMLASVNLSNVKNIGTAAFGGCTSLASIELPALLSIEATTEANQAAFYNCNSLQAVNFPTATTINGFVNCANLEEAYFQKATNVGNNAFVACPKLISLGFGSTVETQTPAIIGTTAFTGLTTTNIELLVGANLTPQPNLTNKTWPTAATSWKAVIIEDGLPKTELVFATVTEAVNFTGNRNLIRKITITGQIQGTDYSANSEWSKFRTLNPAYPVLEEIEILTNQDIPAATSTGNGMLSQATWLKKISIPNTRSIGDAAFNSCSNLEEINFPSVTTMGSQAFSMCYSLSTINFPSVTTVGPGAFSIGQTLSSVSFGTDFTEPTNISLVDKNTQVVNTYPVFNQTNTKNIDLTLNQYVLPIPDFVANTWNGYEWKSISVGNIPTELTFETIAEAIDYKGYVYAVRKITITGQIQGTDYSENSEWSKLTTLNETYPALTELAILTEQAIPDRDTIIIEGKNTYRSLTYSYDGTTSKYNTWLQAFSAPNAVAVGNWAFYRSAALESVSFANAKTVNTMAFAGCNKLTSIPASAFPQLTTVGNWAFSKCNNITEINFPMAFEIQGNAFSQCVALSKIVLPKVTNIGFGAFFECNAINNVTLGTDFMSPTEILLDASSGTEVFAPQTDLTLGYYVLPAPTPLNDNTENNSTELRVWHTYTWNSINLTSAPDYLYTVVLQASPEDAGTTMFSNAGSRDLVSIRATSVNDCYHFTGWADSQGTVISEDNPFELALTRDTTLTAVFRQDSVELQINASTGGTVTPNGTVVIPCGEDLTITATANAGYVFVNWSNAITGAIISNNPAETLTLEQYTAHPSIIAKFAREDEPPVAEYTLTLLTNPTDAGTLTGAAAGRYNANTTVRVTATANEGYVFDNWTDASSTIVSEDTSYSFTITGDITLTANFTQAVPTITTQPQSQDVPSGGTFTLSIVATGLGLQYQWQKDGSDIAGATSATYTKSNVVTADSGSYVCVVSNTVGNVSSEVAVIKVVEGIEEYVSDFSLTPNPTPDFVTIKMDVLQSGKLEVSLIDLAGSELVSLHNSFAEAGHFTKSFSLASLPPAVYYIRIVHSGNVRIEKIIHN